MQYQPRSFLKDGERSDWCLAYGNLASEQNLAISSCKQMVNKEYKSLDHVFKSHELLRHIPDARATLASHSAYPNIQIFFTHVLLKTMPIPYCLCEMPVGETPCVSQAMHGIAHGGSRQPRQLNPDRIASSPPLQKACPVKMLLSSLMIVLNFNLNQVSSST